MFFKISLKQRLKQLFCRHNYFAIAVTEEFGRLVIYECEHCKHIRAIPDYWEITLKE